MFTINQWRQTSIFWYFELIDLSQSSEVKSALPPDLEMKLMASTNTGKNITL